MGNERQASLFFIFIERKRNEKHTKESAGSDALNIDNNQFAFREFFSD